jgi:general secretion pathway protein D
MRTNLFHSRILAAYAAAILLLGGCATQRSFENLKPGEPIPLTGMNDAVVSESAKLRAAYDELLKRLDRIPEAGVDGQAVEPSYDPLEDRVVSINMYDVEIGQLLLALADQQKLNLIVDPLVLEQKFRANLYLNEVTVREVYNHVLDTFDGDGLPGLSSIPGVGALFGEEQKSHATRELVLVLRVRML